MHKPRPRQAHNIRNIPDNVLPILLAGSIEVQPLRPLAALMAAPRAGDAETLVQDSVTSREPGRLLPPADPIEVQPVAPAGGLNGCGACWRCRNGNAKFWSIPGTSPFTAFAPRAQIASAPGAQHAQSLKFRRPDIAAGWSH